MKKLLVAAMGIAAAYGAFADPFSVGKRFEGLTVGDTVTTNELNEGTGGTYWTDPVSATNTYTVKAMDTYTGTRPAYFGDDAPNKALEVKTAFGQPLKFNFTGNINSTKTVDEAGLYFDSLVKFTVCDGAPEDKDAYNGAKIMMWLQSDDDTVTNIVVKAGYLTYSAGTVSSVATNYTCYTVDGDFADKWHRVTIKAIANITSGDSAVPGFVVFIDEEMVNVPLQADYNIIGSEVFPARNENAVQWETLKALFPSIVQTGDVKNFSAIEFDGTGSINDVTVTDTAPDFAKDLAAPEVTDVYINGDPTNVTTIAEAVALANNASTASISLNKSFTLGDPLVFTGSGTITLDFAGFVLTNELAGAAITNNAATLIITNSVGNGGIYCTDWEGAVAICNSTGKNIAIQDGVFYGLLDCEDWEAEAAPGIEVSGGAFTDGTVETLLVDDKTVEEVDDLFVVVDKPAVVTYTVDVAAPGSHVSVAISTNTVEIGTAGGKYTVDAGADVAVVYTPDAGYELTGTASFEFSAIAENKTIETAPTASALSYAVTYTLTAASEAGSAPAAGSYTVETTSPYVLAQPEAVTGYTFSGWYDNDQLTGDPVTQFAIDTSAPEAKAFYGKFTATTYTVTFYTNSVEYATVNYTYGNESSYAAPANPAVDGFTFGGWFTDNGTFQTAFEFNANVAGNTQVAYAKLTSSVTPIDPSAGGSQDYTSAEEATAAATTINSDKAANIAKPSTVTAEGAATYYSYVQAVASGTTVKIDFTSAGEEAAQTSANTDVEALPVASAAAGDAEASVNSIAGLYYSIVSGATPSTVTSEGTRVLGTGSAIKLTLPKVGTAGFYKVKVSARSAE